MTDDNVVSIPLIKFSMTRWPLEENDPEWNSFPAIRVQGPELDRGCYGVKIEDDSMAPDMKPGVIAVFSLNDSASPVGNIYVIGRKGDVPLVRKVVKNEISLNERDPFNGEERGRLRKSFMTPTPLHIPGSRVSPIAESTHQTIFLKSLKNPEKLTLVPRGDLLWMHPLVFILNNREV